MKKLIAPLVPTLSVRNPSIVPSGVEMADEESMDTDYMGQSNPMYDNGKNLTGNQRTIDCFQTQNKICEKRRAHFSVKFYLKPKCMNKNLLNQ